MSEQIIHILLLDNSAAYAPALPKILKAGGLNARVEHVETLDAFRMALSAAKWDAVLSAYAISRGALPAVDGKLPFVVLCEPQEEDEAFALAGPVISDVLPVTHLKRLPFILRRELSLNTHRDQEVLAASEAKYRLLAENTADVIWIFDTTTMHFTYVSPSVERLRGYTPDEVLSQSLDEVAAPASLAGPISELPGRLQAFLDGNPSATIQTHEVEQLCKDGSTVWTEVVTTLLKDSTDRVQILGVSRDISARKQAEQALRESEGRFQDTLDNMLEGFQIIGFDWRYRYVNDAAAAHGRRARAELLGHTMMERYPGIEQTELFAVLRQCMADRTARRIENLFVYPDGNDAWFELNIQPVPEGISILSLDITERKAGENALRAARDTLEQGVIERTNELQAAKERVEAILNNSPDGVLLTRPDLRIEQANLTFDRLFACKADDYFRRPLFDLIHPDDVNQVKEVLQVGYIGHIDQSLEIRARRLDGSVFAAELSAGYIDHGSLVCTIRDITARKQAEKALQESAAEIHDLYNNAPCGYHSLDKDGLIVQINDTELRWLGYDREEVVGKLKITDLFTAESVQNFQKNFPGFKERGWVNDLEFDLVCKDSSLIHILLNGTAIYDEHGQYVKSRSSVFDISELKQAEQTLNAKIDEEREFQGYLKALHDITIELAQIDQLDEFYKHAVEAALQRLGLERMSLFLYDREHNVAVGTYGTDPQGNLVDERDLRFVAASDGIMGRAFAREERFYIEENAPLTGSDLERVGYGWNAAAVLWNGTQRLGWLVADNLLSHKPASKPMLETLSLYALAVGTLLTRKRAEAALRESEARFRHVIEAAPDYILMYDTDGIIQMVNPAALSDSGYTQDEMIGHNVAEFFPPESRELFQQELLHTLETGVHHLEERFVRKDGSMVLMDGSGSVITGENGQPQSVIVLKRDITQRKQTEETLRQALAKEKELSELKSRFVSMASHEFRTPLATILATTETLAAYRQRLTDEQIEHRLDRIKEHVGYLKDIMEDVLLLAKMQARRVQFAPVLLDPDALCRSVLGEFQSRPDIKHQLVYTCAGDIREVRLDRKLVRQIISNIVNNAIKYSPADKPVTIHLEYTPEEVVLTVHDEGIGIPESDQKHLFEPFHRAANVGDISGTGLGLVIVKESVELHGGMVSVDSQVGVGTTLTVTLPVRTGEESSDDKHSDH
jgi:PAS domain S-box-containing protein